MTEQTPQPQTVVPPVQQAHIDVQGQGGDIHITIAEQSSDRWHRCLNALWDDGIIASLSDRAYRVMGALLRLRTEDGTARAPITALCEMTGYKDRTARYGLGELLEHPRRLLAVKGRDLFEILPGWSFAGRRPDSAPPTSPTAGLHQRAKFCTPVQDHLHQRAKFCTPVHDQPAASRERVRGAENSEFVLDDDSGNSLAAVVDLLLGSGCGFSEPDARRLGKVANGNVRLARNAIAKAEGYRKANKLKTGPGKDIPYCMRALISTAIREQWALFDQAGVDERRQRLEPQYRLKQIGYLRARMERVMSVRELETVRDAWDGWDALYDSGVLTTQWQNWGDQVIRRRILDAAGMLVAARHKGGILITPDN